MALIADSIFFFFFASRRRQRGAGGPVSASRPNKRPARSGARTYSLPSQNVPSDSACVSSSRAGAKIDF